jgi:hypothetical protein
VQHCLVGSEMCIRDRYVNFIQTYPSLYERLPLKMIAAYIGVTPEHLSSIRKQLSRK